MCDLWSPRSGPRDVSSYKMIKRQRIPPPIKTAMEVYWVRADGEGAVKCHLSLYTTAWPVAEWPQAQRQSAAPVCPVSLSSQFHHTRLLTHSCSVLFPPNRADCGIDPRLSVSIYDPLITLTLTPKLLNCWQGQYCIGNPLDLNQWLKLFVS